MPIKFGNPLKKAPTAPAKGKSTGQAMLPDRAALSRLTKGNPEAQSLGNYAKATPSGAAAMNKTYPEIMAEGEDGASVLP
jgi:hypothetical protein